MSAKHTPGPWREGVTTDPCELPMIVGADSKPVCAFGDATPYDQSAGSAPNDADMALILAAPDLLAACEALLGEHEKFCTHGALPAADKARDAIAKAKGGAQ